jgi:Mg-chelatase subunit ChlD
VRAGIVALTLILLAGCAAAGYAVVQRRCSGSERLTLEVSAAPALVPALTAAVERFNDGRHRVEGDCVKARLSAADSAAVAIVLSGQGRSGTATHAPDVWIPDSGMWVDLVDKPGAVRRTGAYLAATPVVVAVTGRTADRGRPSWQAMLTSERLRMPDPTRDAAGLGALLLVRKEVATDRAEFTQIVRAVRPRVAPAARIGGDRAVVTTEQAVRAHNRRSSASPVTVLRPTGGDFALDHPFTVTGAGAGSPAKVRAARLLEEEFTSAKTRAGLQAAGFAAAPDGTPVRPEATQVRQLVQDWSKLTLSARILSLIDVSGSMAEPVPGAKMTRLQAITRVSQAGLSLQPDDTELGQWVFSTRLAGRRDWRENVSLGPLGERIGSATRRQHILSALSGLRPVRNGDTGLYDTVLAAFRYMRRTYKPDMVNTVLLLTDGRNDDADGPTLSATLARLRQEYDPDRPIQVVMIGFGPDVDHGELKQIADATHGSVHIAHTPQDIGKIFLSATARRLCSPEC